MFDSLSRSLSSLSLSVKVHHRVRKGLAVEGVALRDRLALNRSKS